MTPEGEEYLEPCEWGKIVVLNYLSHRRRYATDAIQRVLRRYEVDDEAGRARTRDPDWEGACIVRRIIRPKAHRSWNDSSTLFAKWQRMILSHCHRHLGDIG